MQLPRTCADVTAHLDPKFGGVATSVPALAAAVRATGRYESIIGAFTAPFEAQPRLEVPLEVFPLGWSRWLLSPGSRRRLQEVVRRCQAVHIHGLWQQHCILTSRTADRYRIPYIISAHGMLEPWALNQKAWKKSTYAALFERATLEGARCLRALTRAEAEHYRMFGLRRPVAVIPNGVAMPEDPDADLFLERFPQLRGKRILLFLGRLHPKKGLHVLCRSWASLYRRHKDSALVIAGPASDVEARQLTLLIDELGLAREVVLTDMLVGNIKWAALAASSGFVLPSYSEGFSMATLEALAVGKPVIISQACYFPEVESADCGWIVTPEEATLRAALSSFLEESDATLREKGDRGKHLILARYTWATVGKQVADLFDWVLGGRSPQTVELLQ